MWTNLPENALKFSAGNAAPRIEISAERRDRGLAFCVRDNGAGFDPAYADKLFGMFQRLHAARDFEGTGVGLAVVKRIIERHGGRVWAEGRPDRRATFWFTLPAAPAAAAR